MVEGSREGEEEKQPGQEAIGRQKDVALPARREKLDSAAAKRFISQEESGSAEMLCPLQSPAWEGKDKGGC